MCSEKSDFLKALSKKPITKIPLYCTGYPELEFIENYIKQYNLKPNKLDFVLNEKNYSIIEQMGFDAISLWDFRKGKGGYPLDNQKRVDGWGRIYKGDWYMWDGVFKDKSVVQNWEQLNPPSKKKLNLLKTLLDKATGKLEYVISLPGLFEKTWQSMGLIYFAKSLKKNISFVEFVVNFFSDYMKMLIKALQHIGAKIYLIADDYGYKNRTFIPKETWRLIFTNKYEEIINIIHKKKQKVIIHSDGYISDMIEVFVELGFDAVQSLEANAGVDIFKLFKQFQNQICFIGNLDISLLSFGSPHQIEDYVVKLISKAYENDCSFVISPTQQINSKCKPENINAMIQTTKKFK
ncbi:MAG: uroporphyrinogen decarboxylase family protein [Candidatus Hodarchaeota archaeon]